VTQLRHIEPTDLGEADRALKTKHRAMWAMGNYPSVVTDVVAPLGPILVDAAGIQPGDVVLDVAAGSGNAAIPAARAGARVIASDLTPELLETGQKLAAEAGVQLTWETADAEALPYGDSEFDAVLSCLGVMFAPHHQTSADELIRVCRGDLPIGQDHVEQREIRVGLRRLGDARQLIDEPAHPAVPPAGMHRPHGRRDVARGQRRPSQSTDFLISPLPRRR